MFSRSTHITLLERLGGGVVIAGEGDGSRVVDQEAWRAFHERYGDLIRGYARMRGVQPADCDDLVQEVMVSLAKVMQSGFVYDPSKGTFRSYLKTTVVRAIARRARQNRAVTGLEGIEDHAPTTGGAGGGGGGSPEQPDEAWEQQWRQHHTRLAMKVVEGEFNATDLEAFQRYALLQHDVQAVARDLKISVDSVYQAKSRILRRLSKLIAEQVAEEG
ncbi:MAG: sigma-70 family RNA polymerase sigma factor [Phycisphaerales bacterium]